MTNPKVPNVVLRDHGKVGAVWVLIPEQAKA